MISLTYDSLITDLTTWIENQEPEFVENMPSIIGLGELRLLRDLDVELFDQVDTVSVGTNGKATKPTGYVVARTLSYVDTYGRRVFILPKQYEYVLDYGGTGDPLYNAELNETEWLFAPKPSTPKTVDIRYVKRPNGLSPTTQATWFSTTVPDALFFACLVSSEDYIQEDDRMKVWKAKYEEVLALAKTEVKRLAKSEY